MVYRDTYSNFLPEMNYFDKFMVEQKAAVLSKKVG